ncbi:hypothetical protein OIU85_005486 [Salix viminalis]|uniref:Phosphate transporter n=1 Tax=Salix viminalis TaxID=40686 RepID=A0A9Q0PIX3_SALVM|nr:hypothetical protein OIU85_005486 [Salix viminalis]
MTPSYTLSPSTISPEGHGLHNSHFYLHRNCSSFFSNESSLLVKETLPFKPHEKRSTKSFLPILRLKNSELTHPLASVSSFAEAGGEEDRNEGIQIRKHQETVESKEDDSHGMARAFDISSGTASAISILIAFAALSLPFFMKTLGQGLDLKTKFLSYVTLLFGFYMAWNIGANDVANAMGTSVGSGALTLRQAVLTAAILEFSGALLMGTHVTSTMQKGILVANVFQGRDTLLFAGLLSSLAAAAGGEEDRNEGIQIRKHQETVESKEDDSPGMARAFDISSGTASAISILIAFAALSLPFFMKTLGQGLDLKTKFLLYVTLLFGFYMAWNIGANDVANAMGTSVGSGALTLRQAVLTAAILEFSGALLMGALRVQLFLPLIPSVVGDFQDLSILVASYYGWPVSTTHCIIGSMVGFGLVYGGPGAVFWSSLARVTSSWVISPLMGAMVSFLVYKFIRRFVYSAPNPGQAAAAAAPIAVFLGVTGISFAAFPLSEIFPLALAQALAGGAAGAFLVDRIIRKQLGHLLVKARPKGTQLEIVYGVFGYMQILSACFMSFAHGGNDVSNAIGPLAAALSILHGGASGTDIVIPLDVLAWGGFEGFAAEFAAASVVLVASKLGLPISATHTLVGAVMGVGFARGLNNVRVETVREIVVSWAVTIPVGAIFAVLYTWIFTKLLSYIL